MQVRNTRPALVHIAGVPIPPNATVTIPRDHEAGVRASGVFRCGHLVEIGAGGMAMQLAPNTDASSVIKAVGEMADLDALKELWEEEATSANPRKLVQRAIERRAEEIEKSRAQAKE